MIPTKSELAKYIGYNGTEAIRPMMILHAYKDCNIDCSCCYIRHSDAYCAFDYGEIISDEALENVIKLSKRLHASVFTGSGEPFLHWNDFTLSKLIPLTKKYDVPLILSTNGLWGNNDKIIDEVIDSFGDVIQFSVDFWHKVPIENINHVIDRLIDPDVQTKIYIAQITDKDHPLGHIKPHHYDDLFVWEYPMNKNRETDQKLFFHDRRDFLLQL